MLKGRLGLETARIPHADRHGLLWLQYGRLYAEDGTLRFLASPSAELPAGDYAIPFQSVSCVACGPGTSFTHDALRLLARHGTGLVCVGDGGVRLYASMPFGPDESARARRQVILWSDAKQRVFVARRMYAIRLGEVFPEADLDTLRGMEGARMRTTYQRLAEQFGVKWVRRYYDRQNPNVADLPNQAINHAATAVEAAALVAVAASGAIPQLGFIHEDSGVSFPLDIADLFRDSVTLPVAFGSVREVQKSPTTSVEQMTRRLAAKAFRRDTLVSKMIDMIKVLLDDDDGNRNP